MLIPKDVYDEGYPHLSRDYMPSVPCAVDICPCNKRGKCELPSKINIRADGKCQTGVDFMSDPRRGYVYAE